MQKDILAIFNLQGLARKLDDLELREGDVIFHFRESRRAQCPGCGQWSRHLHGRGRPRLVYHGVVFEKRIRVGLRNNRFLCRRCRKPFTQVSPFIRPW